MNKKGFTLVELMIVVAILGILAAIAIPLVSGYRNRGFDATVKSDLKNMAIAQEGYFAEWQTYTLNTASLTSYGYSVSPGVMPVISAANSSSYSMSASHEAGDRTYSITGPGGYIQ